MFIIFEEVECFGVVFNVIEILQVVDCDFFDNIFEVGDVVDCINYLFEGVFDIFIDDF